jgi:hypothetical protein
MGDRRDSHPEPEREQLQVACKVSAPSAPGPHNSRIYRSRMKYLKAAIERMESIVEAAAGGELVVKQQPTVHLPPDIGRHGKIGAR